MHRSTMVTTAAAVLLGNLGALTVRAGASPDQVLVVYNKDWQEDLDGSDPGQDSEEIARYYVMRRTDPRTGLRPYLLGLSSKDREGLRLNGPVLKEPSRDNWLGLVYKGKGELRCDPWPLTKQGGNAVVAADRLVTGQGVPRYAAAFVAKEDLGSGNLIELSVKVVLEAGTEVVLLNLPHSNRRASALAVRRIPEGMVIAVDFASLKLKSGVLRLFFAGEGTARRELEQSVSAPELEGPPPFVSLTKPGGRAEQRKLPDATGILPELVSGPAIVAMLKQGTLGGILLPSRELSGLDAATLTLKVGDGPDGADAKTIYADGSPAPGVDLSVYTLTDGGTLFATNFQRLVADGPARVWLKARRKDGGEFNRDYVLHDPADFEVSETGPDGVRDDQAYLEDIENPIKEFLETHRTPGGRLLKDHILYICVVRGLPLRVASLYGIERGTTSSVRRGDFGSGSALTQRVRMLYYDVKKVTWKRVLMLNGRSTRLLNVAHSMKSCLAGMQYNPYMHPLTHNNQKDSMWRTGKWDEIRKLDPPAFSAELRAQQPPAKFLYGAGRIDAPSVEWARNQIDGAIYGEAYLTPSLGPVYNGTYQEGPLAARALADLGFQVHPVPARADRALFCFGIFGHGATSEDDVASGPRGAKSCLWYKGFYPGSIGIAIRSYLGWDISRPPRTQVKLFDQLLRGGVTITAGATGGAHDTNVTWWDSFVLNHLMLSGYEYGDATLRASIYLDWTTSLVGDPLYTPDLSRTRPDTTPPRVESRDDIRLEVKPCGAGRFAVRASVRLSNADPEMAEAVIECWPKASPGRKVTGTNTRYTASPHAFAMGLEPETAYEAAVTLIDPYGNRFESLKAFGPLAFTTGKARRAKVLCDVRPEGVGADPLAVRVPEGSLDEQGEIHLYFEPGAGRAGVPRLVTEDGRAVLDWRRGFRIGGAVAVLPPSDDVLKAGRTHHLVLRWRRFPVTREVLLAAPDGTEFLVAGANNLPWNAADVVGTGFTVTGTAGLRRVVVRDDAAAAPWERRRPLLKRFDRAGFDARDG